MITHCSSLPTKHHALGSCIVSFTRQSASTRRIVSLTSTVLKSFLFTLRRPFSVAAKTMAGYEISPSPPAHCRNRHRSYATNRCSTDDDDSRIGIVRLRITTFTTPAVAFAGASSNPGL